MLHLQAFAHANISVTDLSKARDLFESSGVWYEIGDIQIHLTVRDVSSSQEGPGPSRPHLAFWVDEPDLAVRRLSQAGVFVRDVPDNASGYHQLFIEDPDGNVVELLGPKKG